MSNLLLRSTHADSASTTTGDRRTNAPRKGTPRWTAALIAAAALAVGIGCALDEVGRQVRHSEALAVRYASRIAVGDLRRAADVNLPVADRQAAVLRLRSVVAGIVQEPSRVFHARLIIQPSGAAPRIVVGSEGTSARYPIGRSATWVWPSVGAMPNSRLELVVEPIGDAGTVVLHLLSGMLFVGAALAGLVIVATGERREPDRSVPLLGTSGLAGLRSAAAASAVHRTMSGAHRVRRGLACALPVIAIVGLALMLAHSDLRVAAGLLEEGADSAAVAARWQHSIFLMLAGTATVLGIAVWATHEASVSVEETDQADAEVGEALVWLADDREAAVEARSADYRQRTDLLESTLRSIGDAVVCTDSAGRISSINRVAEQLTGWTQAAAERRPVEDVIDLRDEVTGERLANPVRLALEGDLNPSLVGSCALYQRDGGRIMISDSCAGIRGEDGVLQGAVFVFRDTTAEKERFAEIAEDRARLESVIRGTNAAIWSWDLATGRWWIDQSSTELLGGGETVIELTGQSILDRMVHPEDRERLEESSGHHLCGRSAMLDCEVRMRHADREWVWVQVRGSVDQRRSDGTAIRMSGTLINVSARKSAESALRESEASMRALFLGSADPVLILREGRFLDANASALRILGVTEVEQLRRLTPRDISPTLQPDGSTSELRYDEMVAAAEMRGSRRFEWIHQRLDGTLFPVEVMMTHLTVQGESVLHVAWRDIADRLRMEREVRASEQRFRSLFELAPVGIALIELETAEIMEANTAFVHEFGLPMEELIGQSLHRFVAPGAQETALDAVRRLRAQGILEPMELDCVRADGSPYPVIVSSRVVIGPDGKGRAWTIVQDISQRVQAEDALRDQTEQLQELNLQLEDLATRDPLTHLVNRRRFLELVDASILHHPATTESGEGGAAVLYLDLDNFKYVNDSLGHEAGDQLLMHVAQRMQAAIRGGDVAARLGGDEFAILLKAPTDPRVAAMVAERLVRKMESPFHVLDQVVSSTASVGVAMAVPGQTAESILQNADTAMYKAKHSGKSNWRVFEAWMTTESQERLELESALRAGWKRREFDVFFQPILDLSTEKLVEVEALIRWNHPERGLVGPREFIPLAEEIGLIVPMGLWVLEQSIQRLHHWRQEYPHLRDLRLSVNVSGQQIQRSDFVRDVQRLLKRCGADPTTITLEVTESTVMDNLEATTEKLNALREMGIQIAIDDFGTGYSSMSALSSLSVNKVKIDRSFIAQVGVMPQTTAILRALVTMCRVLQLSVVAEGVETDDQSALIGVLGCNFGQGFHFAPPMGESDFLEWSVRQRPRFLVA